MKKTKLRLCSALLCVTLLMSVFTILPTSATQTKDRAYDNTSLRMVEDEHGIHFYGPTGNNLTDSEKQSDDVTVINSLSEYKELTNNTQKTANNKLIRKAANLPDSVDHSQSIYFPSIGNQGSLGSCLYWALIYYQYTYEMNKLMNIPTTEENSFSPQWSYNVATSGEDSRCYTSIALNFMKYQGSVPMSLVPYDSQYLNTYPTEEVWRTSINYRIKDFQMFEDIGTADTEITSPDDSDLDLIKTALSNGEVLTYSTYVNGWTYTNIITDSMAPENYDHVGEYAVTSMDSEDGGHRMTLVGYNDNLWIDINKNYRIDDGEMGAFKIANSWGDDYCDGGYAWVAYDALNNISCVKGVEYNKYRSSIFTEVTRLELMPYGTDTDLYLKCTLNTSDRTQVSTTIIAEKDGTVRRIQSEANMYYGPAVAYDGTSYSTDATLIFPLQSIFPDVTSENFKDYTWTVEFEDAESDGTTLTVKDAVIVDEAKGINYEVSDCYPLKLNGELKEIQYNESKLNHAVIYYRGFYDPSISYKIDSLNAQWQKNNAIPENLEQYGYTHKFVIDLKNTESAMLYFTDKDGNIDNNNGNYFVATKGLNYYVTEDVGKPLTISMTNDMEDVCDVGRFGLFSTESIGGYLPYTYTYISTNLTTGEETIDEEHQSEQKGFYFTQEGEYKITVIIKDCAGTEAYAENFLTITSIPFEFTTFEATEQNNSLVNTCPITFKAVTNYENIGLRYGIYNEYNFTITHNDEVCYTQTIPMTYDMTNPEYMTSTITAQWTPTQAGEYCAKISATDCAGEYAEKILNFVVKECIIGDVDGNGNIDIVDATYLQMCLAHIKDINDLRVLTADTDRDDILTINDATYIQMYLANIPDIDFIGQVLH